MAFWNRKKEIEENELGDELEERLSKICGHESPFISERMKKARLDDVRIRNYHDRKESPPSLSEDPLGMRHGDKDRNHDYPRMIRPGQQRTYINGSELGRKRK